MVFIVRASGAPSAGDDAGNADVFTENDLPATFAFDHGRIVSDYFRYCRGEPKKRIYSLTSLGMDHK